MFNNISSSPLQRRLEKQVEDAQRQIAESFAQACLLIANKRAEALEKLIDGIHELTKSRNELIRYLLEGADQSD